MNILPSSPLPVPGVVDIPVIVLSARDLDVQDRNRLKQADKVLQKGRTDLRQLAGELRSLTPPAVGNSLELRPRYGKTSAWRE